MNKPKAYISEGALDFIVEGNYEERTVREWVQLALTREAELEALKKCLGIGKPVFGDRQ